MLKNHFKSAVRNVWKHTAFSFINITGLTIGLTSCILIVLFVFDELTFDRFHKNTTNIYRVVESRTSAEGKITKRSGTGFQVGGRAKARFPEIQDVARISQFWRPDIRPAENPAKVFHEDYIAANQGFLNMFSFPLLYGNRGTALTEPKSVIVTEETAKKFFGRVEAVGKLLFFDDDSAAYTVTGVLQNFPVNSSLSYNLLVSESSIEKHFSGDWTSGAFATYFLLNKDAGIQTLNKKLDNLINSNNTNDPGTQSQVQLQALKDLHFYSNNIEGNSGKKGNISYVYVFLVIACFIIFIACINYMNLSTARFTKRGKEIAVRKVAGASRTSLLHQFLVEVLLITILSIILSIALVNFLLPPFNAFAEKQLTLNLHTDYRIWTGVFLMIVSVTFLAGLYPALFQSGLKPLALLKNKFQPGRGNISLRRSLVVFQFMISIVLIAATIIIYQQMKYVNTKDMGFDKDKLLVIDINSGDIRRGAATIKSEFAKLPQVKSVAVTSTVPGAWKTIPTVRVNTDNSNPSSGKDIYYFGVDAEFLSTYGVALLKGRNFFSSGNADSSSVLINETAAKALGITDALNQPMRILSAKSGGDNRSQVEQPFTVTVAGIVKDFNFQSLHEPLAPMVIGFKKNMGISFGYFTVKLSRGDVETTLQKMKTTLYNIDQTQLFEYHFLDKQWELLYHEDKIRQTIFLAMALLAIFIAALGLLGLTMYEAEQRVKEIGIRKVLGASVGSITLMLSKDFLKLVLISSIVAIPVAWFFMHQWLEDFAYRIQINWWVFVCSAFVAAIIAMSTICFQVIKAAVANPVKTLRTE
jgi:putative ABC transport system permease protein